MNTLMLTGHAAVRIAQRGIKLKDAELIAMIGTEVDDGYLVRTQDYQEVERTLKSLLQRLRHVVGKRLVVANGQIITAYHASGTYQRRLLRHAYESDLTNDR
jgi:urease gamma subunit